MEVNAQLIENKKVTIRSEDLMDAYENCKDINSHHAINSLKVKLRKAFNIDPDSFLEDGSWKYDYEVRGGSHGWDKTVTQRPATTDEKFLWASLRAISKIVVDSKL